MKNVLTLEDGTVEVLPEEVYNIVIFDASGRVVTRCGTDTPFLKRESFFELLSETEKDFFLETCRAFGVKKLLLDTTRGPMLVYCSMFAETGLFVGVLFHTQRETVRDFWQHNFWKETVVSPRLAEKTLPRKQGDRDAVDRINECYGCLTPIFDTGVTPVSLDDGDWVFSVLSIALRNLAKHLGCALSLRRARHVMLSDFWAFSMPSFATVMTCLLSLAASASLDQRARVELFEEDGRAFICFYTTLAYFRDKKSRAHSCEYSELADCAKIAERHDLFLDMVLEHKEEGAALAVRFSPEYQDISLLGFKHPLRFRG